MISKLIPTTQANIHIKCIGKTEIESNNLQDNSIKEIVHFFSKKDLKVFYLEQEHGTQFHEISAQTNLPLIGDASYTTEKNIALVIKTADCIPLFFWSEEPRVIGAIHSGWRGTAKNITQIVCSELLHKFQLKNLNFFICPCIRQQHYEIDEDVALLFQEDYPQSLEKRGKKYLFGNDLVVKEQIQALPLKTYLEDSEICNYSNTDYYSHRRKEKGRNLNFIYME